MRGFKKSNLKFIRFFDQNDLGSLPRTFLSGLSVLVFFYFAPSLVNFINFKLNDKGYENNSKKFWLTL